MKNLFIQEARPAGVVTTLPSQNNWVGGPPVFQPSHPFTFFQTSVVVFAASSNFFFSQFFLSSLILAVAWFLRVLKTLQITRLGSFLMGFIPFNLELLGFLTQTWDIAGPDLYGGDWCQVVQNISKLADQELGC